MIVQGNDTTRLFVLALSAFRDTLMILLIRVHLGDHGLRRGALRSGINNHAGVRLKIPGNTKADLVKDFIAASGREPGSTGKAYTIGIKVPGTATQHAVDTTLYDGIHP